MIQTMLSLVVVIGVALLDRLPAHRRARSSGSRAIGVLAMITLALTWLSVALGMVAKSVETASNLPDAADCCCRSSAAGSSPPTRCRPACAGSPSTSRSRRSSRRCAACSWARPIGNSGVLAVAWCAAIALVGYLWAKRLFNRDPTP